ncbi:MAG: tRNA (adenosine(37)-N6)-threonylcarbamoyltransferase complex transferase subunit TsaD, partial [Patescibacteria group bacterium]|nr:tRNA (adenosine(37)-N6)-threonylcarbamoyltransferase complex transferase subunit TsaD [Patescibacteria group bacterium]
GKSHHALGACVSRQNPADFAHTMFELRPENTAKKYLLNMKILAIETSCDETAISIIEATGGIKHPQFKILSDVVLSQVKLHAPYGGVFPNLAKREHSKNLVPVLAQALKEAGLLKLRKGKKHELAPATLKKLEKLLVREPKLLEQFLRSIPDWSIPKIDAIAFTSGPGLEPALWVGINFAKALSLLWGSTLIPVNHMEGHIFSAFVRGNKFSIPNIQFPMLALLISGGHTELILIKDWLKYKKIGETRDDAAGEAFDKVARILGLPYPGGPEISRLAISGKQSGTYTLPRPMLHSGDLDFSFSGLKTAVLYLVQKIPTLTKPIKAAIAKEFQQAVTDVLVKKTLAAARAYKTTTIVLGGGVSANTKIREDLAEMIKTELQGTTLLLPEHTATTDNAIMIGIAGYFRLKRDLKVASPAHIHAQGNLSL